MDWIALRDRGKALALKHRYVLLVLLAGILLMLLPAGNGEDTVSAAPAVQAVTDLQEELGELLSHLEGAGRVRVLLTEAEGAQTLYQSDADDRSDSQKTDTVLVTGSDRTQTGLIQRVDPPKYQGAVILCQGAGRASVRLAIVEAVANATGLPTSKISVLKMK